MLLEFWRNLFENGEVQLFSIPELTDNEKLPYLDFIRHYFNLDSFSLAGPVIAFDPNVAIEVGLLVARACWFFVSMEEPTERMQEMLKLTCEPNTPEAIATGDFLLRYLLTPMRRLRSLGKDDPFSERLVEIMRQWPLTGVLCDLLDPPLGDLEFAHHTGLQLRYAERLADHWKNDWLPHQGKTREIVELVFSRRDLNYRLPVPTPEGIDQA